MQNSKGGFRQKPIRTLTLFVLLSLAIIGFVISVTKTALKDRDLPSRDSIIHNRGLRGKIISKDGYTLSKSSKTYQATIFTQSLNPNKKDLFIKLFSIYSGIDPKKIETIISNHHGYTVLAKKLDQASATRLKSLAYELRRLNVFVSIKNKKGMRVLYGLDISENGEKRYFPLNDTLSPVIGYVKKIDSDKYTRVKGVKGIEKSYQKYLNLIKDGYIKGMRDVGGTIIRNRDCITKSRQDGMDVHLNIPLNLQRRVEVILDSMKKITQAKEIIAGIMESKTGKVIALASSQRYNPNKITQQDVYSLNPKFGEFLYEPGSVMKPITLSVALEHNVVKPDDWFDTKGGKLDIGSHHIISDDEVYDSQTATDIIVHSSNVGISKIAWRLSGKEFHDGISAFGLAQISGIDLSRELTGKIKNTKLLSRKLDRANQAYGYGMYANFSQLLKAYSAFNNNGIAVTPKIVDYLQAQNGKIYYAKPKVANLHPISKKTANEIKKILIKVVNEGTGKAAIYPGLEIGGKTGTAQIVQRGLYVGKYNSSFYGFANDKNGNKYTIGVLAMGLTKHHMHFASQSAVPIFKKIIDTLVELGYLKPDLNSIEKQKIEQEEQKRKEIAKLKQKQRAQQIKLKLKKQREEIKAAMQQKKKPKKKLHKKKKDTHKKIRHTPKKSAPIRQQIEQNSAMPDLF